MTYSQLIARMTLVHGPSDEQARKIGILRLNESMRASIEFGFVTFVNLELREIQRMEPEGMVPRVHRRFYQLLRD